MTIPALPRAFTTAASPGYFLDFILMPIAVFLLLRRSGGLPLVLVGVMAWQFAEYLIHRLVFHHMALFQPIHNIHHTMPKSWVGVASSGTALGFAAAWIMTAMAIGPLQANAVTAGLIIGYLAYCCIHFRFHHSDQKTFGRYVAFMARHHAAHHRGVKGNYGVSSPLIDILFRTYRR